MSARPFEIRHFSEVTSTNDLARDWLLQGGRDGATVIADSQSRGRGRVGREWCSPPKVNIYLSQVFTGTPERLAWLPLLGALAARETVSAFLITPLEARIKWPNDIEVLERKVAGILAESVIGERSGGVLGLGINVNMRASQFPATLRRPAASLRMLRGSAVERKRVLEVLLARLCYWRGIWREHPEDMLHGYARHCVTLGRRVEVELPGGEVLAGIACALENQGHLVLEKDDGSRVSIVAGEAVVIEAGQPLSLPPEPVRRC